MEVATLLGEIESSTSRISELVLAMKEYTFMDQSPCAHSRVVAADCVSSRSVCTGKFGRYAIAYDKDRFPRMTN